MAYPGSQRHDRVAVKLHYEICKAVDIQVTKKWYEHQSQAVTKAESITILWNQGIHTDRTIAANKPDITIGNRDAGICYLIDVAIPSDRNIVNKRS